MAAEVFKVLPWDKQDKLDAWVGKPHFHENTGEPLHDTCCKETYLLCAQCLH